MSDTTVTELDKDKILAQLARLPKLAQEMSWEYNYDETGDELVYGLTDMPDDSFLYNVNDEINLFVTPDSTVNGVFIEYFVSNYLEHNKELKPVLLVIEGKTNDKNASILAKDALEGKLLSATMESLFAKDNLTAIYK